MTLVQDPATARFDGMPQSAIEAGVADVVLSPAQIAAELVRLVIHPYVGQAPVEQADVSSVALDDTSRILSALGEAFGVDFSGYKSGTVNRRIERRMVVRHVASGPSMPTF